MSDDEYIREANHTSHPEGVKPAHKEYIYDLGEHPVRSDYKQRFRDTYNTTRPEYNDHAFNAKIDGKTRKIRIPAKIVREIHLQCESEAHPITFHQKLQPNYVDGQTHGPNKVGKMTFQNVGYYNSIQSSMMMPNYFRQKAWAIQNEIFDNGLKYRQVNGEDYPTIEDVDYSEEVAQRMFYPENYGRRSRGKKTKKSSKKDKPITSKLRADEQSMKRVLRALPHIKEG